MTDEEVELRCCDVVVTVGTIKQDRFNTSKCTFHRMHKDITCILVWNTLSKIVILTLPVADTIAPRDFTKHSSVALSRSVDVGISCSKLLF